MSLLSGAQSRGLSTLGHSGLKEGCSPSPPRGGARAWPRPEGARAH